MEATFSPEYAGRPKLAEVQIVTRRVSRRRALPDVQRIDVTKVVPMTIGEARWEAEAEVWQPNATIKSLGLEPGGLCSTTTITWFASTRCSTCSNTKWKAAK